MDSAVSHAQQPVAIRLGAVRLRCCRECAKGIAAQAQDPPAIVQMARKGTGSCLRPAQPLW
jgi:hypothetical protein